MEKPKPNSHVVHPKQLVKPKKHALQQFNNSLALVITNGIGTMWTAYVFTLLALVSLPAILTQGHFVSKSTFPSWLISVSLIALVAWIAQTFIQLVLLPIIMVGQNVIQGQQAAKAEADHLTLTYLANLQDEQMAELKNQGEILDYFKEKAKVDMADKVYDFSGLKAIFFNGTLSKSPDESHTDKLIKISTDIMKKHGVQVEVIRTIDQKIATGVWPDMREHGWKVDDWPKVYKRVMDADILVLAGPIWLGDNSSETKKVIERLYACSSILNNRGQYAYYGKVGGCLITGNEDGIKHCAMNVLYSLQHLGYCIPPQADAGWIGEAGPGPSYGDKLDDGSLAGLSNDFTNRNTTFMTWNLMHLAKLLKDNGGIEAYGNQRSKWDAGSRFDFSNPEYR